MLDPSRQRSVLLIDDNQDMVRSFTDLLEDEGYLVLPASSREEFIELLSPPRGYAPTIDFVLLDLVLNGNRDAGLELLEEISRRLPTALIVMYTGNAPKTDQRRWKVYRRGAHRFINKGSARELLNDFQYVIQDMEELEGLARAIETTAKSRVSMFSALVGSDVELAIFDLERRLWYSNRPYHLGANGFGRLPSNIPCWSHFHGLRAEDKDCKHCIVKRTIETRSNQSTTLVVPSRGGELRWLKVASSPFGAERESDEGRLVGVRTIIQKLSEPRKELEWKKRLRCLSNAMLTSGLGRVRIYRAEDQERIRCLEVNTIAEAPGYRAKVEGFETSLKDNAYMQECFRTRRPTVFEAWDHGENKYLQMTIEQTPPWIDYPLFSDQQLVGWLAVDLVGTDRDGLAETRIEGLRQYESALIEALMDSTQEQTGAHHFFNFAKARVELAAAEDARDALANIIQLIFELTRSEVPCHDVRVRLLTDGVLHLQDRINPSRAVEVEINEEDNRSVTAMVAKSGNALFIDDRSVYTEEARSQGYPVGLEEETPNGLAILPIKIEGVCVGTLHVEASEALGWSTTGLKQPLATYASMLGPLLREIATEDRIQEARDALEREVALAFGAIHGVKQPVQAGRDYLETLDLKHRDGTLTHEKFEEYVKRISMTLGRIERLANRLLRLSRPSKHIEGWFDLPQLLTVVIDDTKVLHPNLSVLVEVDLSAQTVRADPSEIRAVIEELILNSSRADAEEVRVVATADDGYFKLDVRDDGKGIGELDSEKLFERFFTDFGGGTGLGLSLVRRVAEDMGGSAHARSLEQGLQILIQWPENPAPIRHLPPHEEWPSSTS